MYLFSKKMADKEILNYLSSAKEGMPNEKAVNISIGSGADTRHIGSRHLEILRQACAESGNYRPVITSGYRDIELQIKAMYRNIVRDYAGQRRLYLGGGQRVIDAYDEAKKQGKSEGEILAAMLRKARETGPENVSRHCAQGCVFDVAASSLQNAEDFKREIRKRARKVLDERSQGNNCIHIEL